VGQFYDGFITSWITLIYDENLRTSREGIRDAQYMTFSIFVIDAVLWRIFDDPWWKWHVIDYNIFCCVVFLGVLVPTNTKLTHVFGSKVFVLVLVCYKLTLTPPSKHDHNVAIISKKGEEGIRSRAQETGRGSQDGQWRNFCQSMAESTAVGSRIPTRGGVNRRFKN
jgi:hypothetical protein